MKCLLIIVVGLCLGTTAQAMGKVVDGTDCVGTCMRDSPPSREKGDKVNDLGMCVGSCAGVNDLTPKNTRPEPKPVVDKPKAEPKPVVDKPKAEPKPAEPKPCGHCSTQ